MMVFQNGMDSSTTLNLVRATEWDQMKLELRNLRGQLAEARKIAEEAKQIINNFYLDDDFDAYSCLGKVEAQLSTMLGKTREAATATMQEKVEAIDTAREDE